MNEGYGCVGHKKVVFFVNPPIFFFNLVPTFLSAALRIADESSSEKLREVGVPDNHPQPFYRIGAAGSMTPNSKLMPGDTSHGQWATFHPFPIFFPIHLKQNLQLRMEVGARCGRFYPHSLFFDPM